MSAAGGIGGFVGAEPQLDKTKPLYPGVLRMSSGRACLARILQRTRPRTVHVPSWICPELVETIELGGWRVVRYAVGRDLLPEAPPFPSPRDLFLLLNPFGLADELVRRVASQLGDRLVVDQTQALYQPPPPGCWGFASARKMLGVPDGAFLWSPSPESQPVDRNCRVTTRHLDARASGETSALELFRENESFISSADEAPSDASDAILDRLDHSGIRRRRQANFRFLHSRLAGSNQLEVSSRFPSAPAAAYYPYLPDRAIPRSALHLRRIWVSQMWPGLDSESNGDDWSRLLAASLLPLPIDQRYGEREMNMVLSALAEIG